MWTEQNLAQTVSVFGEISIAHFLLQVNKLICPALKLGENRNVQTLKGTNQPDTMDASFGNLNYNDSNNNFLWLVLPHTPC